MNYCFAGIFLLLYIYYIFQIVAIAKGKVKNIVVACLCAVLAIGSEFFGLAYMGYAFVTMTMFLFVVFYGDEPIVGNRVRLVVPGILLILYGVFMAVGERGGWKNLNVQIVGDCLQIRAFFLGIFCLAFILLVGSGIYCSLRLGFVQITEF